MSVRFDFPTIILIVKRKATGSPPTSIRKDASIPHPAPVTVTTNWFEELTRKMAAPDARGSREDPVGKGGLHEVPGVMGCSTNSTRSLALAARWRLLNESGAVR